MEIDTSLSPNDLFSNSFSNSLIGFPSAVFANIHISKNFLFFT